MLGFFFWGGVALSDFHSICAINLIIIKDLWSYGNSSDNDYEDEDNYNADVNSKDHNNKYSHNNEDNNKFNFYQCHYWHN